MNRKRVAFLRLHWPWMLAIYCWIWGTAVILGDYGIPWDESVQATYGERILRFFSTLGADQSANSFIDLQYYGGLFEFAAAAISRISPFPDYLTRHAIVLLVACLVFPAVAALSRPIGGDLTALAACLCLVAMPRFFGDAFYNSKDIPLATFFAWSMASYVQVLNAPSSIIAWLKWGGWTGAALSIRVAGGMLLLVLAIFLLGLTFFLRRIVLREASLFSRYSVLGLVLSVACAWLLMVAFWPWALIDPIVNPVKAFYYNTSFPKAYEVMFMGSAYSSNALPRFYLPFMLLIATPPVLLFLSFLGVCYGGGKFSQRANLSQGICFWAILLWVAFPIVYFCVMRPNVYNGVRHFLFVLPGFAVLSGLGVKALEGWLGRWKCSLNTSRIIALIPLSTALVPLVRLHPYQCTYFSSLAGTRTEIAAGYDLDYWTLSYKEAAEWLNARQREMARGLRVTVAANPTNQISIQAFLDPRIQVNFIFQRNLEGDLPPGIDYYVAIRQYGMDRNYPSSEVATVIESDGAPLTVIKKGNGE